MTRTRMPLCCAAALGVAGMVVLSGLAPVNKYLFTDNYNNNVIGGIYDVGSLGGKSVAEANGRLQFTANGATGMLSFAGLAISPWGANIKKDFQIEIDSVLNIGAVNGSRVVLLGAGFANEGQNATYPNVGNALGVGVLKNSSGLFVGWVRLLNGAVVDFDGVPIAQTSGKITIEFDRSDNELVITRNGQSVTYSGFYTDFGASHPNNALVISIGCVTANGNITFAGSKARIDNLEFNGFKRARQ